MAICLYTHEHSRAAGLSLSFSLRAQGTCSGQSREVNLTTTKAVLYVMKERERESERASRDELAHHERKKKKKKKRSGHAHLPHHLVVSLSLSLSNPALYLTAHLNSDALRC